MGVIIALCAIAVLIGAAFFIRLLVGVNVFLGGKLEAGLNIGLTRHIGKAFIFDFKRKGKGEYVIEYKNKRGKIKKTWRIEELIEKYFRRRKKKLPIRPYAAYVLDKSTLQKIVLMTTAGVREDAAATALLCGLLTGGVNTALAVLYSRKGMPKMADVRVSPDFNATVFHLSAECIFGIRLAYIIIAGMRYAISRLRKKV